MTQALQNIIEQAWEDRSSLSPTSAPKEVLESVEHVLESSTRAACA